MLPMYLHVYSLSVPINKITINCDLLTVTGPNNEINKLCCCRIFQVLLIQNKIDILTMYVSILIVVSCHKLSDKLEDDYDVFSEGFGLNCNGN